VKSLIASLILVATCGTRAQSVKTAHETEADRTPKIKTGGNFVLRGAKVLTGTKGTLENTDILVLNGKISAIGKKLTAPEGVLEINAVGKVVAPGIIDAHSHRASDGTNEGAESISAETRIADVLDLKAMNVWQAVASGHTSALSLHGSANAIGGESVVIKYKFGRPASEGPIAYAPRMIKFALGENVTQKSSTNRSRYPQSRMGVESVYRRAFTEAKEYKARWEAFRGGSSNVRPRVDLRLQTLADILDRKVWVHCHSYRADEMLMMVRLSQEFGFKLGALQHALEAYKIAPEMAAGGIGASMFIDAWSYKQEAYDAIPWNAWICHRAGMNVSINTDGLNGTTALNIDAAKVMRYGGLSEEDALQMVTINPAKQLGIDAKTGSIEVGKDADIVVWDGHPLSVYSRCNLTFIDGECYFQRRDAYGVDANSIVKTTLDKQSKKWEGVILPRNASSYAIIGATVHTVDNGTIANGTVVIRDGKIAQVSAGSQAPSGATQVNGRGLHVYPGFIDGYTNVGLVEISAVPAMSDGSEMGTFNPDLVAQSALYVESAHYGPAMFSGILNVLSAPGGGTIPGQASLINTAGKSTEELGFIRNGALILNFASGGTGAGFDLCDQVDSSHLFGKELGGNHQFTGDAHLTDEQREQFYDFLGGKPFQFQDNPSNFGPVGSYFERVLEYVWKRRTEPGTPVDLKLEAVVPYLMGERPVVLNVGNASSIRSAVDFAKKYKLKAVLAGARDAHREVELLAKSGIPVIISPAGKSTLFANGVDKPWDPYDTPYVKPALLAKAGVKFAFQSGSAEDVMNLAIRVGQSCAYGLSPERAIRALTLDAAEILGAEKLLGSITPGKVANLIVTDGDPFELTTKMQYVFIKGQPQPLSSRQTMLRDKYLARQSIKKSN
jgi:imidazolonepropionase-like amidohydrolase